MSPWRCRYNNRALAKFMGYVGWIPVTENSFFVFFLFNLHSSFFILQLRKDGVEMAGRYYKMLLPIFYIIDFVIILFAFYVSYILCFGWNKPLSLLPIYRLTLLYITPAWLVIALLFRTYREDHTTPYKNHLLRYAQSQFCFIFFLFGLIVVFRLHALSRLFIAYFIMFEIAITLIFHLARHKLILEYRKTGHNYLRIMLIGDAKLTNYISNWLPKHPEVGLRLEGVLSNAELEEINIKTLRAILVEKDIDYVIVVLSRRAEKLMPKIVSVADNIGIRVKIMAPPLYPVAGRTRFYKLAGIPIINLRNEPLEALHNRILKRILDIIISLTVLVTIHSWLTPIVGAIIRLTSKGPAIFRQKRVGKEGKKFVMYKFRTMGANHHKSEYDAFNGIGEITKDDDSRITPIGNLLRQTDIDEFPQFFNVFIGNMSVVGPRPHMVSEDIELQENLDKYPVRRYVKPGITGWAQINGYRGGTKDMALMQKRTDYDIWYVENWSFWLDIKVIATTFWQTINRKAH